MVWEYLETLNHLLQSEHAWENKSSERKYAALIVIMSVTVVETFLNVFFRTLVENDKHIAHREWVVSDIKKRISIEEKLRKWPVAILGKQIELGHGPGQLFQATKKVRNFLVHFVTEHETVVVSPDVFFDGMADTTAYHALKKQDAVSAVRSAQGMIEEILKLTGATGEKLAGEIHHWTGKPG